MVSIFVFFVLASMNECRFLLIQRALEEFRFFLYKIQKKKTAVTINKLLTPGRASATSKERKHERTPQSLFNVCMATRSFSLHRRFRSAFFFFFCFSFIRSVELFSFIARILYLKNSSRGGLGYLFAEVNQTISLPQIPHSVGCLAVM